MNNFSASFIRRPVMTTLLVFGLLLFGIIGYLAMPVSDLPNVDFPTIQVTANLPGASPETMASAVATPLERAFSTIPGIDSMTSTSSLSQSKIVLQFDLNRSIDGAAQDVQAAISQKQKKLPKQMETPPFYSKVNPADAPILFLAVSSDSLPMSLVDKYAESCLAQQLSMIDGVAQVNIYGSQKFAVRIQVDPMAMATRQLSFEQLVSAIQNSNVNLPTGTLRGSQQTTILEVEGQLYDAAQYQSLIVAYRNGMPVYLSSIGRAINGVENNQTASWYNQKPAVILAISRQPETNTVQIITNIKKVLPTFEKSLPAGIKLTVVFDRSQSIMASIHEVQFNLISAAMLVILVIFLFLKNISATLIPSIVLPVTVIGTFAFMALFHFSIDNISLMGLALSVGFFVDDAIVMLENIIRHIEQGKNVFQAALDGSREIGFTVVSMTLSLLAAFIPLIFMPGLIGRLLHEFAVTIVIAIMISGLLSLTLTPMMASRLLSQHQVSFQWLEYFEKWFIKLQNYYQQSLAWSLARPAMIMMSWFTCLLLTALIFVWTPKGFIPDEDTGLIFGNTEASLDTSFLAMTKLQAQVAQIIRRNLAVESVVSNVNGNSGRMFIRLKPGNKRPKAEEVIQDLRESVASVAGIKIYLQNSPALTIGGRATKSQYQFNLQGPDLNELFTWGNRVLSEIQQLSLIRDVSSDLLMTNPQLHVDINRNLAASMHVSLFTIENTLANALGSQQISTIYAPDDEYEVLLEVAPEYQKTADILGKIYVKSDDGNLVPLSAVASFSNRVGPQSINHQNQLPAVTLSFNVKEGVSLGNAVDKVSDTVAAMNLPDSITTSFQGSAKAFQDSLKGFGWLIFLAIAVIYIVLGILYESFIHPLIILSTLPTAGVGALLILLMTHTPLDVYGFIGILMLIGIVKKNAIMMIDFALAAQRYQRLSPQDAIYQACLVRFRPIMMTTFAAFMGALPIALAFGAGADARRALGLTVVGGLLTSQILTLFITPTIYLYIERFGNWITSSGLKKWIGFA